MCDHRSGGRATRFVSLVLLIGFVATGLALHAAPPAAAEPEVGVPLPATYFTGSMAPEPEPGPCPPSGRGPDTGLCVQNGGVTVTIDRKFIFVGETITATASSGVAGVFRWTTSSFTVSGCQDGDSVCTFKPFATGPAWRLVGASVLNPNNLLQGLAFGETAYNVDAHLVEGTALVENLMPPPLLTSPYQWPSAALRLERTNADGTPTDYLYNGLFNVFGQQLNIPPGTPTDGYCYFCAGTADLNGLSGINALTGQFRMYVPTGYYTLTIIRYPFPGELAGRSPLPGWQTPITFFVDKDTEIHLRRDLQKIEGRVTSPSGQPLAGVGITARRTGTFTGESATTTADGRYSMMVERGTYDVIPAASGRFNPTTRFVDASQGGVDNVDFVQETSFISGWLSSDEGFVRNWTVEAVGTSRVTATTDDTGFYELELEPALWTVKPVGGVWDPVNQQIQLGSQRQTASFTCTDVELCGNPSLTLSYVSGPSQLDLGEPGTFVFTIANVGDQTISDIVLTGPEPVTGRGGIALDSGPTPPAPTSLEPGASQDVSYVVIGDVQGEGRFRWSVTGTNTDGDTVGRSVSRTLQVGEDEIDVAVRITRNGQDLEQIQLEGPTGDPPAWVPQDFTVEVTVTNNGLSPIDNAHLEGSQHGLDLKSLDGPIPVVFPLTVLEPYPDAQLGTLAPGVPVTRTYQVRATNGAHFEIIAPVRADSATGTASDTIRVLTDVVLHFQATGPNQNARFLEGSRWEVHGTVTNVSATETIRLLPLVATAHGNAGPIGPIAIEDEQPGPDEWVPPLADELLPGDHVTFTLYVDTAAYDLWSLTPEQIDELAGQLFATSSVSFDPKALIFDAEQSKWVQLDSSRIKIEPGSTQFQVLLDQREPDVVLRSTGEGLFEVAGEFTFAFYQGWVNAGVAFYNSLPGLYALGRNLSIDRILGATTDYLVQQWYALSPGNKGAIVDEIAADLWEGLSKFADVSGKTFEQFKTQVNDTISNWMFQVDRAGDVGDHQALVDLASQPVELAGQYVVEEFSGQALMGTIHRLSRRSSAYSGDLAALKQARQAEIAADGATALLRVGDDLTELLPLIRRHFGVSETEALNMLKFAKDNDLVIAVRARRTGSVLRLEGDFLPKPEAVKLKNVDEIDTRFLEYDASDIDTVVLKKPVSSEQFFGEVLPSVPAEMRDAVLSRYLAREEEWSKYLAKNDGYDFDGYAENGVPVGMKFDENGIPSDKAPPAMELRQFTKDAHATKPDYYRLKIADEAGVPRGITGDVDAVYIGRADGLPLTPQERVRTYMALNKLIGLQHPETFTWLNEGRSSLLAKHYDTAATPENLLVFGPNGRARVGLIDEARSRNPSGIPGDTGESIFTYVEGADRGFYPGPAPTIATRDYPDPFPWTAKYIALGHTVIDRNGRAHELRPSRDPNAGVYRPRGANGLQQWQQGRGWFDVDLTTMPDVIPVQPQTGTTTDHAAGTTRLEIAELADLDRAPGSPWFQPGDTVAIDLGGPGEQIATVSALGSIILTQPTLHALPQGTLVTVIPSSALDSAPPTISCGTPPTAWSTSDVVVNCTATDAGSGLANPADASFALTTTVAAGTASSNASTGTRSVCDVAGHCATAGPITGLRVDRAVPTVTVTAPAAGVSFAVGAVVTAAFTCADVGSGIASCTGPTVLDTATAGDKTFTVVAVDLAGNRTESVVAYRVTAPTPTFRLMVSTRPDRRNPVPLAGAKLGLIAYIYLPDDPTIARVRFELDGTWLWTVDNQAPWNLIELLGLPLPLLTALLRNGSHSISAYVTLEDGRTVSTTSTFTTKR